MEDFKKLFDKAIKYHKIGLIFKAIQIYEKLIEEEKNNIQLLYLLGTAYIQVNKFELAIEFFKKLIILDNKNVAAYNNLGAAFQELKRFEEAIEVFKKLLSLDPNYSQAKNNLASCLANLKKFDPAIKIYDELIESDPKNYIAYNNLGNVYKEKNNFDSAIFNYQQAIQINSNYFITYKNLGDIYKKKNQFNKSLNFYNLVNKIKPGYKDIISNIIETKLAICDWEDFEKLINELKDSVYSEKQVNPFLTYSLIDSLEIQKKASENYIKNNFFSLEQKVLNKNKIRNNKPKIGYFSSDFNDHAVLHSILDIFRNHNKSKFDFYAFSLGPEVNDDWNSEVKKCFNKFVNINDLLDEEVADLSRKIGLDIAVDLNGHTKYSRPGIFFYRCAPIQINYLGYVGTMGANFMDYIIADEIVIPKESKKYYSEKVIYLKNCYQPNMKIREIAKKEYKRKDFGLTDKSFVFCSFNSNYKITPQIYDVWMNILKKVPNSIIWILLNNTQTKDNLINETKKRGVNPDKVIFAERLPINQHLKRLELADIFLDTYPCNAGATATDALRMGLPIITIKGESFASRMASSLLNALNLNNLVTSNKIEYENLAINLGNDKKKLSEIKKKLTKSIIDSSLFDSVNYTDELEIIYEKMLNR